MHGGHPEGFGNHYRGAAELISAGRAGHTPEKKREIDPERTGRRAGGGVY